MILERRCSDGGWNYGNRKVLGTELPSYPETTALALVGLAGCPDLDAPVALAQIYLGQTRSPLAKAWLRVALCCYSAPAPPLGDQPLSPNDVIVNALEVMAAHRVLA
jgi:hypothetical protein